VATSQTSLEPFSVLIADNLQAEGSRRADPLAMRHFSARQGLIEALKGTARGERAAFERVYAATAAKLFGIVVRILGRRDWAEGVLQDVYVCVWQRASEFDPATTTPLSWLTAIARKRALDAIGPRTPRSIDDDPELLQPRGEAAVDDDHEPDEERRWLQACLDGLEPERRRLLLLAYFYGMTHEEIARNTNRPVATVKAWLRYSLAELKGSLGR
jgi:RNA polymerase sigma-70 factor (ECF subfamily)